MHTAQTTPPTTTDTHTKTHPAQTTLARARTHRHVFEVACHQCQHVHRHALEERECDHGGVRAAGSRRDVGRRRRRLRRLGRRGPRPAVSHRTVEITPSLAAREKHVVIAWCIDGARRVRRQQQHAHAVAAAPETEDAVIVLLSPSSSNGVPPSFGGDTAPSLQLWARAATTARPAVRPPRVHCSLRPPRAHCSRRRAHVDQRAVARTARCRRQLNVFR